MERLLKADDKASYAEFLTLTSRMLRGFVARRVPPADAEDVLQEILISLHKARHTYDGTRLALPWVMAIAHYRLADYLRRHYSQMRHKQVDISEVENMLLEEVTESSATSESISEEVKNLGARQQKILHLMHSEGYTAREVGSQLGMNESAVKVAAHRAYKQIRMKLLQP